MKCPGCKNEVARLVMSPVLALTEFGETGCCESCLEIEKQTQNFAAKHGSGGTSTAPKAEASTAPSVQPPPFIGEGMCKRGCGQFKHRGSCKPRKPAAAPRRALASVEASAKPSVALKKLEEFRAKLEEENNAAELEFARTRLRLEAIEEAIAALG